MESISSRAGNGENGLVSVIIPTFNRSDLLMHAVKSVHGQTYRPIECIVVDDGSTDDTSAVLRGLMNLNSTDFSLRYVQQSNSGSQVARNHGAYVSNGAFLQFLDSDDLLASDKIQHQVDFLKHNIEFDAVFGDWRVGTERSWKFVKAYASKDLITQFLFDRCVASFSMLMRRRIFEEIGGWDPEIRRNQEIDLHVRAILAGAVFAYVEGDTGLWRIHDGDRIITTTGLDEIRFFFEKMVRILKQNDLYDTAKQVRISNLLMWFVSQNKEKSFKSMQRLVSTVVSIHPEAAFFNTKKMRLIRRLFGDTFAIQFWLRTFLLLNR
jgi:glycosyltransferase involved in cell wall biosynthesis